MASSPLPFTDDVTTNLTSAAPNMAGPHGDHFGGTIGYMIGIVSVSCLISAVVLILCYGRGVLKNHWRDYTDPGEADMPADA
ncbi:Hypp229 [Branchiostoma lanceolatum]|uniref:Hypp229 protein n=1 Tax=Branchiostoma lanceolatum TaxID=7740 RepID=A0A8J9YJX5_BRALA|nr:Hypp229 [Branchiostoma lanceolatum]